MALVFGLGAELITGVRKETHLPLTKPPRIACTCTVSSRVEPVFENAVSELTRVASRALSVSKRGASDSTVGHLAWVPALSFLAFVGVGTVGPVVTAGSYAPFDLVRIHAELIGAVDRFVEGILVLPRV